MNPPANTQGPSATRGGDTTRPPSATPRRARRVVLAVAIGLLLGSVLLNAPYLQGGFHADDILLLNMLRDEPRPFSWWGGLWSVSDLPLFTHTWWRDADAIGTFWRPLPTWVLAGSVALFGEAPFPLHLLSILLHAAVGFTLFLIVRRLMGRMLPAALAGLLFVAGEDHSMTIGWITTLTDLLCGLGVLLAILAHLSWLRWRRFRFLGLSLAALVLALASKESAVAAPILILLLTFLMPAGSDAGQPDLSASRLRAQLAGLGRAWRTWVPAIALLALYLILYRALPLGQMRNLAYFDPFGQTGPYLGHLVEHLPVMWLATLSPIPPSLAAFTPHLLAPLAVAGAVLFMVWLGALRPLLRRPIYAWALLAYFATLLPQMGTDASERGLYLPLAAGAILLSGGLMQLPWLARRLARPRRAAPRLTRMFAWFILLVVLLPGIAFSALYPPWMLPSLNKPAREARTALPLLEASPAEHVLVLNTSGPFMTLYLGAVLEHAGHAVDLRVLSACNGILSVERSGPRAFILRTDRAGWLDNLFARIFRTQTTFRPGQTYATDLFQVTLLELTAGQRDLRAARFDLERAWDDPALLILYWDGRRFRKLEAGALAPGETLRLADTSDVWASMM